MVSLSINECTEVNDYTLGLITLSEDSLTGILEGCKVFPSSLAFPLELFGNFLLHNQCFKSFVPLLLCTGQTQCQTSRIRLLLVNESAKSTILFLVRLDLRFELLCLFCELRGKGLEFFELHRKSILSWVTLGH